MGEQPRVYRRRHFLKGCCGRYISTQFPEDPGRSVHLVQEAQQDHSTQLGGDCIDS
jgi:hypothetical protein